VAPAERAQVWLLPGPEVRSADEAAERSAEEVPLLVGFADEVAPVEAALLPVGVVDEVEVAVGEPEPVPAQDASTRVPE